MATKVTKMQACGNDFVILDYDEYLKCNLSMSELSRKLCDRAFGIGADGLIIPNIHAEDADIAWYFYNADGTTSKICGSAIRCFARYVYDRGFVDKEKFTVKVLSGVINIELCQDGDIKVNMPKPIVDVDNIPFIPNHNLNYKIAIKDRIFEGNAIFLEKPHFVIFAEMDDDINFLVKNYAPTIETCAEFPEKTNVEFVKIKSYKKMDASVWKRGKGIVNSSASGACAIAVAGILNDYIENNVNIAFTGGNINVEWKGTLANPNFDVILKAPAKYVFEAEMI